MDAIVSVCGDWGIGAGGRQGVVIPEDRRRFRRISEGGAVIVGRKTFMEIGGPLPNRKNIVLTRNEGFRANGVTVVNSIGMLLEGLRAVAPMRAFVIGGGSVYGQLLPYCSCAFVTKILLETSSDTFFPDLDKSGDWRAVHVSREHEYVLPENESEPTARGPAGIGPMPGVLKYVYVKYERIKEQICV